MSRNPKTGLFFHWCNEDGDVENQGYLLALNARGYGKAQLFEWFFGEPSTVIEVTPPSIGWHKAPSN